MHRVLLLVLLLFLTTAARGAFLPTIRIEAVEVSDPPAYASLVARANEAMRTKYQVALFLRAYSAIVPPGEPSASFTLSPAASSGTLATNRERFASDSDLADLRRQLTAAAPSASMSVELEAVRFDGTNAPGWLCNSLVRTNDESALLARVAELAALPAPAKPLINVFRVTQGTDAYTHLVSINAASATELAALLQSFAARAGTLEFSHASGTRCTLVATTLYREMTTPPP